MPCVHEIHIFRTCPRVKRCCLQADQTSQALLYRDLTVSQLLAYSLAMGKRLIPTEANVGIKDGRRTRADKELVAKAKDHRPNNSRLRKYLG